MTENRRQSERRRHKRFRAKEGAYAILSGSVSKMGQILDISKGGIGLRYIDIGDRPKETCTLDLLWEDNGFLLENVVFEIASDEDASKDFPYSTIPMRRCGGRFTGLSNEQIFGLEHFIENYTESEA